MNRPRESKSVRLSGLTLIEVMIAVALLSIGLAGLASMHLNSLQFVHSAYYRSIASIIAVDFEERLWLVIGEQSLSGCPETGTGEDSTAETLLSDWGQTVPEEIWAWSDAEPIIIPGLSISTGTPATTDMHTEVPVALTWYEGRFGDVEQESERFEYTVRILCRPIAFEEESES